MTEEEKIKRVLYQFEEAGLISKDIEKAIECFSDQMIGIGIGEQGFVKSIQDVRNVYEAGLKDDDLTQYMLEYNWIEVLICKEEYAVVCADITINSYTDIASRSSKSKLLQSLSMIKEHGEWKICGLHASTPIVTEEVMEAYPLKFAEKTLQSLREKIGEEAYLAEEQYRKAILADTIAFYVVDFTLDIFEKCQLNCDWCAYTEPGVQYEQFLAEKASEYLVEEDKEHYLECFSKENISKAFQNSQNEVTFEYRMKVPDEPPMWMISILRLITDIVTGHQKGIMYVKNIDQSKRNEMNIKNRATYDEMTGVYNKGMLMYYVSDLLAHTGGIFIMFDVDDFKVINDTFGHPTGDQVLVSIAKELMTVFKEPALIGRMGGDEFCVFIPGNKSIDHIKEELKELQDRIHQIQITDHTVFRISGSMGVAVCEKQISFDEIYKRSDQALYLAKKNGKDRISYL